MRHLGHLSSWQNLFRDSRIDGEYYCSWHSDFVLNGTEGLRQTDSTARAVWKPTLSCLVHWAGGTHANGAQNKQLNQATCEVRLLDVASESAMLVGLLVILAVRLPLPLWRAQATWEATIDVAITEGLTSMGAACAKPMGTGGHHICSHRCPGEAKRISVRLG